jgi:hypothetical protein
LGDIKHNRDRPIAAAILSACLFDQVSGFFFKGGKPTDRARKFVDKYLPKYKHLKIYDILRNPLVHHYSISGQFSVTSDPVMSGVNMSVTTDGIIYMPAFIEDLDEAIGKAMKDIREDPDIKKHALGWHKTHKVLAFSTLALHSNEHKQRLWKFYKPLFEQHHLFAKGGFELSFELSTLSEDGHVVYVVVKELDGEITVSKILLDQFAVLLVHTVPADVLRDEAT